VTLLFDGDAAGAKAVQAAFPLLAQHALRGLVAQLPKGEDPDSYIRAHGADALRRLVTDAQGIVEYLIDTAAERAGGSAADRAAAVQALVPVLQTVASPVEMELYVQRVAQRFDLPDSSSVRRQLRSGVNPTPNPPNGREQAHNSALAAASGYDKLPTLQEKELLGALFDQPAILATEYAGQLKGLLSPELREVVDASAAAVQESGALDLEALFSALKDSRALSWVQERLTRQTCRSRDDAEELLKTGLPLLEKAHAERERSLRQAILEAWRSGDSERAVRLTKQRDELKRSASVMLRRER
jgi:DNA primase